MPYSYVAIGLKKETYSVGTLFTVQVLPLTVTSTGSVASLGRGRERAIT